MKRSKSSRQWLDRHFNDPYVKLAKQKGFRSRAVFKLLEIQEKDRFIKPGMRVVDLGAAPGGWSQAAVQILKEKGQVIALDLLAMDPLPQVDFIQGDFREETVLQMLMDRLSHEPVDVVLSDMAPNLSGHKNTDQWSMMALAEMVLDFAVKVLSPDGVLLIKLFNGAGFEEYLKLMRQTFQSVVIRKPDSSRSESAEVYLLGKKLR